MLRQNYKLAFLFWQECSSCEVNPIRHVPGVEKELTIWVANIYSRALRWTLCLVAVVPACVYLPRGSVWADDSLAK